VQLIRLVVFVPPHAEAGVRGQLEQALGSLATSQAG
jgi:hypothetical protein